MLKPVITQKDGKYEAKLSGGLDFNKDGENSVEAELVLRADSKEALEEALAEAAKQNLPKWLNWLKPVLGIKA